MQPYVFDVNNYLKNDNKLKAIAGGTVSVLPLVGYENTTSPFILYWWMPGTFNKEAYYINVDFIRYHVLDTDAERGFQLQQGLMEVLNRGDNIQGLIPSSNARILWAVELRSGTGAFNAKLGAPGEREGFYEFQLNFEIGYVPLGQTIEIGQSSSSNIAQSVIEM